jgi:hypothetical protein
VHLRENQSAGSKHIEASGEVGGTNTGEFFGLLLLADLPKVVLLLLLQVRFPLDFGLVQSVHDGVLALLNEDPLDLVSRTSVTPFQCRVWAEGHRHG